jgi:uncharacterized protein YdaU (DUF1376 family)
MSDFPQFARLPWYPRDFRSSTLGWPLVARAVLRELLDAQWDTGGLPDDPVALRRIVDASPAEWRIAWPIVQPKFERGTDGKLRNRRLEEHRKQAVELSEKRRAAANKRHRKVVPLRSDGKL